MLDFTQLDVWLRARRLASLVYELTRPFPKEEIFALTSQMRRAAVSVSSNIAEGCGRGSAADTCRMLYIARGSLFEVESQSYVSFDQGFLSAEQLSLLLVETGNCKPLLNGFIGYFERKRDQETAKH